MSVLLHCFITRYYKDSAPFFGKERANIEREYMRTCRMLNSITTKKAIYILVFKTRSVHWLFHELYSHSRQGNHNQNGARKSCSNFSLQAKMKVLLLSLMVSSSFNSTCSFGHFFEAFPIVPIFQKFFVNCLIKSH